MVEVIYDMKNMEIFVDKFVMNAEMQSMYNNQV